MKNVYYYARIPSTDPRLGRHVRHDPRSLRYPYPTEGLTLVNRKWQHHIPVLNQGNLGSCTCDAGIDNLGTDLFFETMQYVQNPEYTLDNPGVIELYKAVTLADSYPGNYPPDDTGSDGLTVAKVLQKAGMISGYQHTFSLDDALKALTSTAFITGINWYGSMFRPDADGRVRISGSIAGGHEVEADELDVDNKRIWFLNSWGSNWGVNGRFYLTWDDYGRLLSEDGDVTIFVPNNIPAPEPLPTADDTFAKVAHAWLQHPHLQYKNMKAATQTWLTSKNL